MLDFLGIKRSPRERLAYIELKAQFEGQVQRRDLVKRFGIKLAAASRDLALYLDIAPDNLTYDPKTKVYHPTDRFQPLFPLNQQRIISWVFHGYGDGTDSTPPARFVSEDIDPPATTNLGLLANITATLSGGHRLTVEYDRELPGIAEETIIPTAVFKANGEIHVRGWQVHDQFFKSIALRAIAATRQSPADQTSRRFAKMVDHQWETRLNLELAEKTGPGVLAAGSASARPWVVPVRAALAGHFLSANRVDCSDQAGLPATLFPFALKNPEVLRHSETALLAPGFELA